MNQARISRNKESVRIIREKKLDKNQKKKRISKNSRISDHFQEKQEPAKNRGKNVYQQFGVFILNCANYFYYFNYSI